MYSVGVKYIRIFYLYERVMEWIFFLEVFVTFGKKFFVLYFFHIVFLVILFVFGSAAIAVGFHLDSFRSQK